MDLKDVVKAHVRWEGDVNRDWTLTLKDGSEHKFYAIDGSPQREGDDEFVFDYDFELANFLDNLSYKAAPLEVLDDESGRLCWEYDVDCVSGLVNNLQKQEENDREDWVYNSVPGEWTVDVANLFTR